MPQRRVISVLVASVLALCLSACGGGSSGGCDYFTGECYEPDYDIDYDDPGYEDYDYYDPGYEDYDYYDPGYEDYDYYELEP
jgi:hypothetical protein